MDNLQIKEKLTVSQFKKKFGLEDQSLKPVMNPKNDNMFWICGGMSGACSTNAKAKINAKEVFEPQMILLVSDDNSNGVWTLSTGTTLTAVNGIEF